MSEHVATNAASSGIALDRRRLKELSIRSDVPGILYLAQWAGLLLATGGLVWLSLGTWWVWPAMVMYGVFLTVPAYALSHETAHGTAFRSRWLNEVVLWVTSLIYFEEPLHRRYTHTNHHTHTWHVGKDAQMPFDTPMDFSGWLLEMSSISTWRFQFYTLFSMAIGRPSEWVRLSTPTREMPKLVRNARIFMVIGATILGLALAGQTWLFWFLILPRILGTPVMLMFTLIQHVEMQENSPSILESTRSFRTVWPASFLYAHMNNHVEHHLFPQVPFYALPKLQETIREQVPEADPGFWRTNLEVLSVVWRRSRGRHTKAATIRQAPHMIAEGGFERIASRSM